MKRNFKDDNQNFTGIILICQWSHSLDTLADLEYRDHLVNNGLKAKTSLMPVGNEDTNLEQRAPLQVAEDQTGMQVTMFSYTIISKYQY